MRNIKKFKEFKSEHKFNEAWTNNGDFMYKKTIDDATAIFTKEQIEYLNNLAKELAPIFKRKNRYNQKGDILLREIGSWLDDIYSIGNKRLHKIDFADMNHSELDDEYCIVLDYVMLQMTKELDPSYIEELNEGLSTSTRKNIYDIYNIPSVLTDKLFGYILNYIPNLNFSYDIVSGNKISNLMSSKAYSIPFKFEGYKKVNIDDIDNDKLRRTLRISGLFKEWNIYVRKKKSSVSEKETLSVCISKEDLKDGDSCHYYSSYLKNMTDSDGNKIILIVCSKVNDKHTKMRKEIDDEYNARKKKEEIDKVRKEVERRMKKGKEIPSELFKKPDNEYYRDDDDF